MFKFPVTEIGSAPVTEMLVASDPRNFRCKTKRTVMPDKVYTPTKKQRQAEAALPYPKMIFRRDRLTGRTHWHLAISPKHAMVQLDADVPEAALGLARRKHRVPPNTISFLAAGRPRLGINREMNIAQWGKVNTYYDDLRKVVTMSTGLISVTGGPPPADVVLAQQIADIADAFKRIQEGPLASDTIVLLLHDRSKVNKRDVKKVLDALGSLRETYLKAED